MRRVTTGAAAGRSGSPRPEAGGGRRAEAALGPPTAAAGPVYFDWAFPRSLQLEAHRPDADFTPPPRKTPRPKQAARRWRTQANVEDD